MALQKPLSNSTLVFIIRLLIGNLAQINCEDFNKKLNSTVHITNLSTANNTEYDTAESSSLLVTEQYNYNVEIRFFFEDNILVGQCNISMRINRLLQSMKINSVPINIIKAFLIESKSGSVYKFSSFTNFNNILTINFDNEVPPALYNFTATYVRIIHEDKTNFFPFQKLGEQRLNQTGVEIIKGQQLFPFVESVNRSRFKIAIKHPRKYTIVSNMHTIRQSKDNRKDMVWTSFNEVLLLPQQLTIVITTFTNVSNKFENVTIWCRKGAQQYVRYAKHVAEKIAPYFRQKYMTKLSKLDIVAFWHPHGENDATLGLVLQREADIIYDEKLHSIMRKREVAHIIARQLAFVWCADAILWSKEGFVTFFGALILDKVYPKIRIMDLMVVQAQQDSLRYDTSSAEYSPTLKNTSKVNSLEPPLNYAKSFTIWRMLYHFFAGIFWTSIREYINKRYTYSNMSTPDDLWTTMETMHDKEYPNYGLNLNFKEKITYWITKRHYAIIKGFYETKLKRIFRLSYIQSQYLLDNDKTTISIPISYTSKSDLNFNLSNFFADLYWIRFDKGKTNANFDLKQNDWFIINIQQTGYYRVNYDIKNWENLMQYLNFEDYNKIHILNRAQIIDDVFYFFLQGNLSYNLFWTITNFVTRDINFVTWYPMFKVFEYLACIYPFDHGKSLTKQIKSRVDLLFLEIGYLKKSDDHLLTIYLREEAVKWACILGISECQKIAASELRKTFENSVETSNMIKNNIWIYCRTLLTTVNYTTWHKIRDKWIAMSDNRFLEYLTCFEDSKIVCHFLKIILLEKPNDSKGIIRRARALLSTVAKHVKNDKVHLCLLEIIKSSSFALSSNRETDVIATLIVIITHVHAIDHLKMIENEVTNVLRETRLLKDVKTKIKKRKLEYGRLVNNGYIFSNIR